MRQVTRAGRAKRGRARAAPDVPLRVRLGCVVRRLRGAAGYPSQEAFADAAGLHRTYAGKVERGEINLSLDSLERLSRALGMSAGELLLAAEHEPVPLPRADAPPSGSG